MEMNIKNHLIKKKNIQQRMEMNIINHLIKKKNIQQLMEMNTKNHLIIWEVIKQNIYLQLDTIKKIIMNIDQQNMIIIMDINHNLNINLYLKFHLMIIHKINMMIMVFNLLIMRIKKILI